MTQQLHIATNNGTTISENSLLKVAAKIDGLRMSTGQQVGLNPFTGEMKAFDGTVELNSTISENRIGNYVLNWWMGE